MHIANEEVKEVVAEIPDGHRHLRTTVTLHDGRSFTFHEATIANVVRAYVMGKTHPQRTSVRLAGRRIERRKDGYTEWQLIEE